MIQTIARFCIYSSKCLKLEVMIFYILSATAASLEYTERLIIVTVQTKTRAPTTVKLPRPKIQEQEMLKRNEKKKNPVDNCLKK